MNKLIAMYIVILLTTLSSLLTSGYTQASFLVAATAVCIAACFHKIEGFSVEGIGIADAMLKEREK